MIHAMIYICMHMLPSVEYDAFLNGWFSSKINSSPPSAAWMRQWMRSAFGSGSGLSPIRRQAII